MYTISIHDQNEAPITSAHEVADIALLLGSGEFEEIDAEEGVWMVDLDSTHEDRLLDEGFLMVTVNGAICAIDTY